MAGGCCACAADAADPARQLHTYKEKKMSGRVKIEEREHPVHGRTIFMTDGRIEVAGALDFGVRIVHLSLAGHENLLYEQDPDLSDHLATPDGWRIHGGHRFWAAPESGKSYYPDNDPVTCEVQGDGFVLTQRTDPWTNMKKTLSAVLTEEGSVRVTHTLEYEGEGEVQAAAWGVTTLKGGGQASFPFPVVSGVSEFSVNRSLSLWGATSLADPRLQFTGHEIRAVHTGIADYFKMGIYCAAGEISMRNLGQALAIRFAVHPSSAYGADSGCNAELFMDPNVMELETLGPTTTLRRGERAVHTECWHLAPVD